MQPLLGWAAVAAAAAAAFFALLDGWYLLRVPLSLLWARWLLPTAWDLLEEQSLGGLVLPSDLDFLGHMNNARYLREADVARGVHLARCGLLRAARALGAHMVLAASCCRYRRSLRCLERFAVRTRLLGWDERAFLLQQRFVSRRDGFVCAVLLVRLHVVGASPGRAVEHLCRRKKKASRDIFRTHVFPSLVMPADLDFLGHMNNARYMREADIARALFFTQYDLCAVLRAMRCNLVMSASCSRYRRSLNVFERFVIHTRFLGWDDRAIYVEQFFVRPCNGFVVAVVLCRFHMTGSTPAMLMAHVAGKKVESPELPEEVLHWLKYNECSSQRMRAERGLQNHSKDN